MKARRYEEEEKRKVERGFAGEREKAPIDKKKNDESSKSAQQSDSPGQIGKRNACEGEKSAEGESPKRVGESFDSLAGIEDGAFTRREVVSVSKSDVGVVGDVGPKVELHSKRHQHCNRQSKQWPW